MKRAPKEKKAETRGIAEILNNSADRSKLQNFIDEAVRCKTRIHDEQENIKVLRDEALAKIGCSPKDFNSMAKLFYNNNFTEVQEQIETLEFIIAFVTGQTSSSDE